jgi:hypothetical protein
MVIAFQTGCKDEKGSGAARVKRRSRRGEGEEEEPPRG